MSRAGPPDQPPWRPRFAPGLLVSGTLHALFIALLVLASPEGRDPTTPTESSVVSVSIERPPGKPGLASIPGAGPTAAPRPPARRHAGTSAPRRRATEPTAATTRRRPAAPLAPTPISDPVLSPSVEPARSQSLVLDDQSPKAVGDDAGAASGAHAAFGAGTGGDGPGAGGPGLGPGAGGDGDAGAGSRRRRPLELFGRVIGGGSARTGAATDQRAVSLREATSLRTHDFFPRLPVTWWPSSGPYRVAVQLCVSDRGEVTNAALLSNTSPHFDPVVLDAVRTWRYRPRIIEGVARPFCHDVVIQYTLP